MAGTPVLHRFAPASLTGVAPGKRQIGVGEAVRPPRQRWLRVIARKVRPVRLGPAKGGKPFGRAQFQMPAVILVAGEYDGPAVDVPLAKLGGGGAQIGPELVIGLSRLQTMVMRIAVRGDFLIGALQYAADHRWREIIGVYPLAHARSEEHTSELQSLMRSSYAVFCLKQKMHKTKHRVNRTIKSTNQSSQPLYLVRHTSLIIIR